MTKFSGVSESVRSGSGGEHRGDGKEPDRATDLVPTVDRRTPYRGFE